MRERECVCERERNSVCVREIECVYVCVCVSEEGDAEGGWQKVQPSTLNPNP